MSASPLQELAGFARFTGGLRPFLRGRLGAAECRQVIRDDLAAREENFLHLLECGVYDRPGSPYRALLVRAGIELGDVEALTRGGGVEGALERLHDEGVYLTLEEFKGRQPIVRNGLELSTTDAMFDNPLLGPKRVALKKSAARGPDTRQMLLDIDHLTREAAYQSVFLESFGLQGRPLAFWRPAPPGRAGMKNALGYAKLGVPVERWFAQNRLAPEASNWKEFTVCAAVVLASRVWGETAIPWPQHVDLADSGLIARWLAEKRRCGPPAVLDTVASSGVRICSAALERGLDISGTLFRFGGEPLTEAKQHIVERAGALAVCHYSTGEVGRIGVACADGAERDDVHLLTDKLAAIQRVRAVGEAGTQVSALLFTTLVSSCPKLMLNVESDDYATVEHRVCGCVAGTLGLHVHVSGIRSYEKLTTEGMSFLGEELITVVESVLPSRFGGTAADYQLVEEEVGGLPKVGVVVSPRVGPVDEQQVVETVLRALAAGPGYRTMMAGLWRSGETLRVVRREPYSTTTAKILPLHVLVAR